MKKVKLFLVTIILSSLFFGRAISQDLPVDENTKLITYTDVVETQGIKGELYYRAIRWFNYFYKDNIINICQILDQKNGKIAGRWKKGIVEADKNGSLKVVGTVEYKINMSIEDNSYTYTITNIMFRTSEIMSFEKLVHNRNTNYNPKYDKYIKQVDEYFKSLISSLKTGMEPKVKKTAKQ